MSVLVTRPSPSGEQLTQQLIAQGIAAHHFPLITIEKGRELPMLAEKLSSLPPDSFLFFLSKNAVQYANSFLQERGICWPNTLSYYAIGLSTAHEFSQLVGKPIRYPKRSETSEELVALPSLQAIQNKKILILRGNGGREHLSTTLSKRGGKIYFCECYQRVPVEIETRSFSQYWQECGITTVVVTSGEMLYQLYDAFPEATRNWWFERQLVVVSKRLHQLATELGWHTVHVAKSAENNALAEVLIHIEIGCQL